MTKTPSAVSRWALSRNQRSHIAAQTSAMFDIHHDDHLIHKESAKEGQKHDNEAENALHSTLQKFAVFSSQTNGTLQNIATKDLGLSSKLVLWYRPSLRDSWNGGCCLQTEKKKKNGNGKKGRRKTSLILFPRIIRLHLPTFMKLKVLQLAPRRERFCMRTGVSYVVV